VKIACIGGGPAGLYLGILVKRAAPENEVVIFERNRPADTFGFGVVFSDATLGNLADADPETHAQITAKFARWDDIEIHTGGEVLRSTGHGFCGLERKALLGILQARAKELGVRVEFESEVRTLDDVRAPTTTLLGSPPDVIVGCDGVASWVRDSLAPQLSPHVDVRPNKFVWLGCTVPYRAFTFIFKQTLHGLYRVHAYPFTNDLSTFIVECREDTWRASGLAASDEDGTLAILEQAFADELAGHRLIKNRSIWRNFPTVRCARWSTTSGGSPVVLVGDAAHTAHFSIGSGTKLAMEDSIALRDELLALRDIPSALAAYEARRRPEVEALQAAAQASLEWFEGTERYMEMTPLEQTYSLMTRSLRVSHRSMHKRDPHLARGMEELLATRAGLTDVVASRANESSVIAPTSLPFAMGEVSLRSRIALIADTGASSTAAISTAAISTGASSTGASSTGASSTGASSTGASSTAASSTAASSTGASSTGASSTGASSTGASTMGASSTDASSTGASTTGAIAVASAGAIDAASTAGLVVVRASAHDAATWAQLAERVHAAGAKLALVIATGASSTGASSTGASSTGASSTGASTGANGHAIHALAESGATARATDGSVVDAAKRAAEATIDLLVLDPGHDNLAIELLPYVVETVRAVWPAGRWIAAVVHDIPRTRNAVVGHAAQLRRAGANLLWIDSPGDGSARLPAAPIADRLRNELHVPTCVDADAATLADLDAAIAAGRADLVFATRMPQSTR
jgi:2-polyprenyl-6-methoxyphenol hydroxylase-like FAD-dependent oxidoreductase/2,4-dienoyl-CoA reductase-like NADH-dependent reductase (Old Yellow Enzyme family)